MTTTQPLIARALRSRNEEFWDALTHGIGAVLALIGGLALIPRACGTNDPWCTASCVFYIVTLVSVYVASTLSHLYLSEQLNQLYRRLDQGFIYLLIVGTYTPFALVYLRTPLWLAFYLLALGVAVGGCVSKIVFAHRVQCISVWLFLALGVGEAISIFPLMKILPTAAVWWMLAGGACYCVGVVFLMADVRRYRFHAIWHLLVIAGSTCHFNAIWHYVACDCGLVA